MIQLDYQVFCKLLISNEILFECLKKYFLKNQLVAFINTQNLIAARLNSLKNLIVEYKEPILKFFIKINNLINSLVQKKLLQYNNKLTIV